MSVIPEGAVEFESDGMPALRFTDDEGNHRAVRIVNGSRAEVDWMCTGEWGTWSTSTNGYPASVALAWARDKQAEMLVREKTAYEIERALERIAELEARISEVEAERDRLKEKLEEALR